MFRNREDAAHRLAQVLRSRPLRDPVVLAIPRGGVVVGAVLARDLGADLDVVLARKIRAPFAPELALGAVAEDGSVYIDPEYSLWADQYPAHLDDEIRTQQKEIARRKDLLRGDRPPVALAGRSVIVTDDGIATGSTMIAALKALPEQRPYEVIVAVPVGPPDRVEEIRELCDEVVCLRSPEDFRAVGLFYEDFRQVDDNEVVALLTAYTRPSRPVSV